MAEIKQIKVGSTNYEIGGLYIQETNTKSSVSGLKTWADIKELVEASFVISVVWTSSDYTSTTTPSADKLATIPSGVVVEYSNGTKTATGTLTASASTQNTLYFVYHAGHNPSTKDTFDEYATTIVGSTYGWEKIGNTDVDLSNYALKGTYTSSTPSTNTTSSAGAQTANGTATVTYKKSADATGSAGAHNHTVTAPTASFVTGVKSTGGTANAVTGITTSGDSFVKSYPGSTKKLELGSVTGVSGSTTASKASAGTAITVATRSSSQTTVGNANVGTSVSFKAVNTTSDVTSTNVASPTLTSVVGVTGVTAGSDASLTSGSAASWAATVESNVLKFSFTPNVLQTLSGGKATVISTATVSNLVKSNATTPSATAVTATKVTTTDKSIAPAVASETKIYSVGGTTNITPYTFEDVTVPKAATVSSTIVTGLTTTGDGATVLVGLGTATTATALTSASASGNATVILSTGLTSSAAVTGVSLADAASHTHSITLTDTSITGTASVAVSSHTHDLGNHTHSTTI